MGAVVGTIECALFGCGLGGLCGGCITEAAGRRTLVQGFTLVDATAGGIAGGYWGFKHAHHKPHRDDDDDWDVD